MSVRMRRETIVDAASFGANVLALALPLTVIQIFDRVIPAHAMSTLAVLALVLIVAAIFETLLRAAAAAIHSRAVADQEIADTERLLYNTLYARRTLREQADPVQLASEFETLERRRTLEASDLRSSKFDLPFALVFIGAFVLVAPPLAWALLSILAVILVGSLGGKALESLGNERTDFGKRTAAFLTECISGAESIKGMRAEPFLERRHESLVAGAARLTGEVTRLRGRRRAFVDTAGACVPVLMAIVGAYAVTLDQLTPGALAAAILLSGRIVHPLLRAQNSRETRRALLPAEKQLSEALSTPFFFGGGRTAGPLEQLDIKRLGCLKDEEQFVFQDLNFTIQMGETVAIKGKSGSGKSVLLRTLTGRLLPDDGEVYWNGTPMRDLDTDSLSHRIALLRKTPKLPDTTALQYITEGDPNRIPYAIEVADALGLSEAFSEHASGFNVRIGGAAGAFLHPSVEARLPIVRALATNADLLLFDEANGLLDAHSDERLKACLAEASGKKTIILVSARPSYLKLAQREINISKIQTSTHTLAAEV